ncbi:MAG TPA: hypothetical protein VFL83_05155 [Anaeromyxobacter sp.]|nr:hypothetical protein [Anaeromyxobacter sp.]
MIVCPVCDHAQPQGGECEVCGKRLVTGPAGIPPVAPVEGLELTRHPDAAAAATGVERLGELEPTAFAAAGDVAPEPVALEATRVAPVDVAVEPAPDVERLADGLPDDAPTDVPLFPVCRYCRTEAMPGERVCARCGMRLPDLGAPAPAEGAPARRCGCGAMVRGALCPSCGARG